MSIAESSLPLAVPVPTGGDDPTKIAMLGLTFPIGPLRIILPRLDFMGGGAGNLAIAFTNATAVTLQGVTAGTVYTLNLEGGRVMATNTTATNLVAF